MKRAFAPSGYIGIPDAARMLAEIQDYTEADLEWLDIGDRLNDAEALNRATQKLRQWLSDGTLTAYAPGLGGKKTSVPAWLWADDKACLNDYISGEQLGEFQFFHADGVMFDGIRTPVFFEEDKLIAILRGDIKPKGDKATRRLGRPKGSGSFDDEPWLKKMEKLVTKGTTPWVAAQSVVVDNQKSIKRNNNVSNENVAQRLYKKYTDPDRP
jgi:hypothetical protein